MYIGLTIVAQPITPNIRLHKSAIKVGKNEQFCQLYGNKFIHMHAWCSINIEAEA